MVAVHNFVRYNFDAVFVATNAPGRSAFNRVERRMPPLSKQLSGIIIHDTLGNHLDSLFGLSDCLGISHLANEAHGTQDSNDANCPSLEGSISERFCPVSGCKVYCACKKLQLMPVKEHKSI